MQKSHVDSYKQYLTLDIRYMLLNDEKNGTQNARLFAITSYPVAFYSIGAGINTKKLFWPDPPENIRAGV